MPKHDLPSVEYLRQLMSYDPTTGELTRIYCKNMPKMRNTRFVGQPALNNKHRQGYRCGCVGNRLIMAHRAAWALFYGEWPDGHIDHINHDPADNRIANLRLASQTENMRNLPKLKNNTSGRTGVYLTPNRHGMPGWVALIRVNRKSVYLGRFQTFEAAAAARAAAEARYGFHPNHGVGSAGKSCA